MYIGKILKISLNESTTIQFFRKSSAAKVSQSVCMWERVKTRVTQDASAADDILKQNGFSIMFNNYAFITDFSLFAYMFLTLAYYKCVVCLKGFIVILSIITSRKHYKSYAEVSCKYLEKY